MARTKQRASAPLYGTPGNIRPANADRITATLEEAFWRPANVPTNKAAEPAEPVAQTAGDGIESVTHRPEETSSIAGHADIAAKSVVADIQNTTSTADSVPDPAKGSTDESTLSDKKNDMLKAACVAMNNERDTTTAVDVHDHTMSDKETGTSEVVPATPINAAKCKSSTTSAYSTSLSKTNHSSDIKRENSEDVMTPTTADSSDGALCAGTLPDKENASFKIPARRILAPRKKLTIKFPTAMYLACSSPSNIITNNTGKNSSAIKVASPSPSPLSAHHWLALAPPFNPPTKRSAVYADTDTEDADFSDFDKAIQNVPRSRPVFKLAPAPKPKKKKAKTVVAEQAEPHHFSDVDGDVEMSGEDASIDHVANDNTGNNDNAGNKPADDNVNDGSSSDDEESRNRLLVQPKLNRKARMVDPSVPEDANLILQATKAGADYYNDDPADDLPGNVKGAGNPELYRNVKWGVAATSFDDFEPTSPFVDFVPGRWERQSDGSVRDQKFKLVVKLIDHQGRQKIFRNPPPKDWSSQPALTALNKRSVQQWRRNTRYRFREVVVPYCDEERAWIADRLNGEGKPNEGWKAFVVAFNAAFAGETIEGHAGPRPPRTQSSLTKDIDRFASFYKAGRLPVSARKSKN